MCDFSQRAECVPAFTCESERGPFVSEVEKRFELEVVPVTFLAIFAGTVLGEKPNFTGRFFEWRRPFDKSTDRL